jgi:hypothetical protein
VAGRVVLDNRGRGWSGLACGWLDHACLTVGDRGDRSGHDHAGVVGHARPLPALGGQICLATALG